MRHCPPTRTAEYLLSCLLISWGGYMMIIQGPFSPIYTLMMALAAPATWGFIAFSVGVIRLIGLAINGYWCRTPILRFLGAMFGLVWWLLLFTAYYSAIKAGAGSFPAMALYPVFMLFEGYSCYRCGQDAHSLRSLSRMTPSEVRSEGSG